MEREERSANEAPSGARYSTAQTILRATIKDNHKKSIQNHSCFMKAITGNKSVYENIRGTTIKRLLVVAMEKDRR